MENEKLTKQEFLSKLYTRREAEEYLEINSVALQHHIRKGNIIPCKEYGKASGKVQLFWEYEKILEDEAMFITEAWLNYVHGVEI